jgi:hypothetical protein
VTYLRLLAVMLMIVGVFVALCFVALVFRAYFVTGAPPERVLLGGAWAVVGPALLFVTASLLEWLAGSRSRRRAEEPVVPVRWGAASERFGERDGGEDGFFPDETSVRE